MIEVFVAKKENHDPPYLAQWDGYYSWFPTQKELLEYFDGWDAVLRPTSFERIRKFFTNMEGAEL